MRWVARVPVYQYFGGSQRTPFFEFAEKSRRRLDGKENPLRHRPSCFRSFLALVPCTGTVPVGFYSTTTFVKAWSVKKAKFLRPRIIRRCCDVIASCDCLLSFANLWPARHPHVGATTCNNLRTHKAHFVHHGLSTARIGKTCSAANRCIA